MEKMLYCETIRSHAQIQALQARSDLQALQAEDMRVKLVSLESVRVARESYALLGLLIIDSWSWTCPELGLLSFVAGMALELDKLKHDLLPRLMVPKAKLEWDVLEPLLHMKNSAVTLSHLRKEFKKALGGLLDEDLVSAPVQNLSILLKDTVDRVFVGKCSLVWLQGERVPWLVHLVTDLLETPVHLSDDSDESDE